MSVRTGYNLTCPCGPPPASHRSPSRPSPPPTRAASSRSWPSSTRTRTRSSTSPTPTSCSSRRSCPRSAPTSGSTRSRRRSSSDTRTPRRSPRRRPPSSSRRSSRPVSSARSPDRSSAWRRKSSKSTGGEVPATMEALVELPGVGRKTANVVLGHALGVPGLPVDRHVLRVVEPHRHRPLRRSRSRRAAALRRACRRKNWTRTSDTLILHGRRICKPRPLCEKCAVREDCDFYRTLMGARPQGRAATRRCAR